MIRAEITMVDGDRIVMPFESMDALSLWMNDEAGTYTGVDVKTEEGEDDTLRDDP